MKTKRKKKNAITLIEIMIVMFLIALITGVVAYNYRGSLDEGKAFKTKAGIEKLETILNLQAAENGTFLEDLDNNWKKAIIKSPLVQNADALSKDGWGEDYKVKLVDGEIKVSSEKYTEYQKSHNTLFRETQPSS